MSESDFNPFADDLLRGAKAIAQYIHESERRTYYLLESKCLPAKKWGGIWISSKTKLREFASSIGVAA